MTPAEQGYGWLSDPSNNPTPPERPDPRDEWPPSSDEEAERMIAASKGEAPAEQGQEREWPSEIVINSCAVCGRPIHKEIGWDEQHCDCPTEPPIQSPDDMYPYVLETEADGRLDALEKELEMCQRYFPFMRRDRDRWKAAAEHAAEELSRLRDRADKVLPEAVKREKALVEALREIANDNDHPSWRKSKAIARAALDQSGKP